jgi:DNA mismatch endonuclease (patch repair protein)
LPYRELKKRFLLTEIFWHGYHFRKLKKRLPKKYWQEKIERNKRRDRTNKLKLERNGWKVLRIWEHEVENNFEHSINKIIKFLSK